MANIRVDLDHTLHDGADIVFNAPCDCTEVTGLIIYYPQLDGTITSKIFTFRDAHRNDIGSLTELFVSGARVKVNVDMASGCAYVQNADTNAYLEAQLAAKAPAGYGLGGEAKQVSSWDDAIQSGFYMSPTGPLSGPWFYGFVIRKTDKILVQKVWSNDEQTSAFGCGFYSAERRKLGSTWGEWEWVNPPMKLGVEYRTTERYNGKVVYTKLISFGALPNTATGSVSVGADEPNVISLHGVSSNGNYIYDIATMPGVSEFAYNYWQGTVVIATTADKSGYKNTYITIKYTKD